MSIASSEMLQYLRICGTCFSLYETDRPDGLNQRCSCGPFGQERWPRYDFNERASLCRCCAAVALNSGSRWSAYFCQPCQSLAMGVSISQRRLVIPIGRHSLMHTWVPTTPPPTLKAHRGRARDLAKTVHRALVTISDRTEALDDWYRTVMALNLADLRLSGGTEVNKYLALVEKKPLERTRTEAFAGLCARLGI